MKDSTVEIKLICVVDGVEVINHKYKKTANSHRNTIGVAFEAKQLLLKLQCDDEEYEALRRTNT